MQGSFFWYASYNYRFQSFKMIINSMLLIFFAFSSIFLTSINMEQPNPILAYIAQAQTLEQTYELEQAYEQTTDFLNKQTAERKLTTERFLLACQNKFHRSMYEIGSSMASSESLNIASELAKEATQLWNNKPKNTSYAGYLFVQKDLATHKTPSFLYYIYIKSIYAEEALDYYREKYFITGTLDYNIEWMALWIDSGVLQNRTHLGNVFEYIIDHSSLKGIPLLRQLINAGYDINVTINSTRAHSKNLLIQNPTVEHFPMTLLDFALEWYKANELLNGIYAKRSLNVLMEMIRILMRAGAKSAYEL